MTGRRNAWMVVVSLLGCMSAHAQSPDAMGRARTHFEAGRALYNLNNYTDAIREFSAGYQLVRKPQFLLNLGQCYRKLDDLDHAREMYKKYLTETPAGDAEREQVQQLLAEIEKLIRDRPAQPPPVIAPPPMAARAPPPPPTGESATTAVLAAKPGPPPLPQKSFVARNWWIFPVGAAVVTGVAVGLYFGLKPADCPSYATLGCVTVGNR
jgi:tetratricopeptide (TPR) repeat protein